MPFGRTPRFLVCQGLVLLFLAFAVSTCVAKDKQIRIPIPKRSKPTPVQALNRDGVKALEKHDYDKAKKLFYQAYLLDPNDPFTLNNLGYIAELEGEVDRAQRFYALAAEQNSEAMIDRSTSESVLGKPVSVVAGKTEDKSVQVNRYNVEAIGLLQKDRAPEADMVLRKALELDRHNAFTLNNIGYAQEQEGEYEQALRFYDAAASTGSQDTVVVTPNSAWRGKPIGEIASDNASKLRRLMRRGETTQMQVARLNLRGVSAINRNERPKARQFFEQAYKLSPTDAFTLNNMGYLAEMDGDRETAQFYYEKALEADRAHQRIQVATKKEAEGKQLATVADESTNIVEARMQAQIQARRARGGPAVLLHRDNTPVVESAPVPQPPRSENNGMPEGGGAVAPAQAQSPSQAPAQQPSAPNTGYQPAIPAPSTTQPQPAPEVTQPPQNSGPQFPEPPASNMPPPSEGSPR